MNKSMKWVLGVLALVLDLLTGCVNSVVDFDSDWGGAGKYEASAPFHETIPLGEQLVIRITGTNGSVRIWGIPGAEEVVVDALRTVRSDSPEDAQARLGDLQVSTQLWPLELEIKTVQPDKASGRTYLVDYEITVPSHLMVNVVNGNGTILLEGLESSVEVVNGNGDVTLADVVGSSWVSVGNGKISAWTHLPSGGQIVYSLGNGTILLSVQPQVSAQFGAKVGNGTITVTGLDLQNVVSGPRQLQGVLGTGEGLIDLSTGNGQITVQGG